MKNASKSANEQAIVDQNPYGIDDNPEVSYKPGDDLLNFIISPISVEGEVPGDGSSTTYEISLLRLESEAKTETNFTSTIDGYQNEAKTNLGNSGDDKKKIDNVLEGSIYASGEIGGTLEAGGKMKVYVIYTEPPKRTQEEWEQLILEIEAQQSK